MWEGAHTVQTYAHVLSLVHAHANKGKHAHTYKAHRGPAPPHCDIQTQKPFVSPKEADIMALQSVHPNCDHVRLVIIQSMKKGGCTRRGPITVMWM